MALLLVLAAALATFASHYSDPSRAAAAVPAAIGAVTPESPAMPLPAAPPAESSTAARIAAFFTDYFGRNLPLFVTLWLLGVLFLTLRFTGGLLYVQRLKYRQNRPLPAPWPARLQALAARAGLRRPIAVLESLRLNVPVVIGHLKPVLLLPAGLVSGLPADEVEALLAHELAHVMRRDYLVNVLQHLLDILFFFHPGVRWISSCVRQEREHCCDDFAVGLCGDAQPYARALARLQVRGLGMPGPALAAAGRPRRLLRRIARLLGGPRLAHDFREGFVSALLLVIGLLGIMRMVAATDRGVPSGETAAAAAAAPAGPAAEALPAGRFGLISFVLEKDGRVRLSGESQSGPPGAGGTWLVDGRDGQVVWYMDLASVAKAGGPGSFSEELALGRGAYTWYRPAGWKVTAQWKSEPGNGAWEPLTMRIGAGLAGDRERLRDEEQRRRAEAELKREELRKKEEELRSLTAAERERKIGELEELRRQEHARAEAEVRLREEQRRQRAEELKVGELARSGESAEERLRREAERLRLEEARLADKERRAHAEARLVQAEMERVRELEEQVRKLMAELVAAGLVDEKKDYKIKLSATSLVVNGKKQPAAAHERIKQFYESLTGSKLDEKRTVTFVHEK